jgi:hypothetical protein
MFGHTPDFNHRVTATGIRLENSVDCLLNGVQIQDAQAGPGDKPAPVPRQRDALVELVRCQRINISGCQILDGTPVGLLIDECADTLMNSTQILDQRIEPLMTQGVRLQGNLERVTIANCVVSRATEKAFSGVPRPGLTLTNNITN